MKKRTSLSRESYADVFPPPLSDIEVARMWRSLGGITTPPPRRRPQRPPVLLGIAAAVVAAAVAFVVVLLLSPAGETAAGDRREEGRVLWELQDGSRASFGADTTFKTLSFVPEDIELLLLSGNADFTVAPAPAGTRRFVVNAGGFELLPRGGRFRVAVVGDFPERRVEVTVHEGQVEIPQHRADGTGPLTLGPGQSWRSEPLGTAPGDFPAFPAD